MADAYKTADLAQYGSEPVELFEFSGTHTGFYTSGQQPIVYNFINFEPIYIRMSGLKWTDDITEQAVEVHVKADHPIAKDFVASVPALTCYLVVRRYIKQANEFRIVWQGVIISPEITEDWICILRCEPMLRMINRMGLRPMYQLACRHPLYSAKCGLNRANFRTRTTVTAINGTAITVGNTPSRTCVNGEIYRERDGAARMIYSQASNVLTLSAGIPGLTVGDTVDVYPGCNHAISNCQGFGNLNNFGGFPYIPSKNPFTGDSLR